MIEIGDTVVVIAEMVADEEGISTASEGTHGTVVGFQGDDPVVSFGQGDPFMTFAVDRGKVEAIRRIPKRRKK